MNNTPRLSENRIKHYFKLAHQSCFYSDSPRTRVGCVVIYKGKILSVGYNTTKTHPVQKSYNKYRNFDPEDAKKPNSLHAEIHALIGLQDNDIDFKKVNIFVYRIKKDGSKGLARPCPACEAMIKNMGIENVYYSTENGWGYEKYENT